jgi:hypothetical protein
MQESLYYIIYCILYIGKQWGKTLIRFYLMLFGRQINYKHSAAVIFK